MKTVKANRCAVTGKFVSAAYAAANPATTMRQTIPAAVPRVPKPKAEGQCET